MGFIADLQRLIAIAGIASAMSAGAAKSCVLPSSFDPQRARDGDLVVTGNVSEVREVVSPENQSSFDEWLASHPEMRGSKNHRPKSYLEFTVEVVEVLKGRAPDKLRVSWGRGLNNGPPRNLRGSYLMVLSGPYVTEDGTPGRYAVMNDVCTAGMVLRRGDREANAVREVLGRWPEPLRVVPPTVGEIWQRSWPKIVPKVLLGIGGLLVIGLVFWRRRHAKPVSGSAPRRPA